MLDWTTGSCESLASWRRALNARCVLVACLAFGAQNTTEGAGTARGLSRKKHTMIGGVPARSRGKHGGEQSGKKRQRRSCPLKCPLEPGTNAPEDCQRQALKVGHQNFG